MKSSAQGDAWKALADPTRRAILELLAEEARAVHELAEHFDQSRPAISRHLGQLCEAGLASARKDGRQRIYRLRRGALATPRGWLEELASRSTGEPRRARRPRARKTREGEPVRDWQVW